MQKFASTLHFSNYFLIIQGIILLGSLIGILYTPCPFIGKILLASIVLGYSLLNCYRQKQWDGMSHDKEGWYLKKGNTWVDVIIAGDSTITSWLTILRFHQPEKRYKQSFMIFKDAMCEEDYRQLVVRLRYFKSHSKEHNSEESSVQ